MEKLKILFNILLSSYIEPVKKLNAPSIKFNIVRIIHQIMPVRGYITFTGDINEEIFEYNSILSSISDADL